LRREPYRFFDKEKFRVPPGCVTQVRIGKRELRNVGEEPEILLRIIIPSSPGPEDCRRI